MSFILNTKVKELVFVLCAHQSSASVLSEILTGLKYDLPGDQLPLQSIANIHLRFLTDVGSHWIDPCPLPQAIFEGDEAIVAEDSIRRFLTETKNSSVVIDAPCLGRLLPLWSAALKSFDCKIRALEIIRDPQSVFDSLQHHYKTNERSNNGINSREHSNLLWWRHVSEARRHAQGMEFLTIPFELLKEDPERQLGPIRAFLEKTADEPTDVVPKVNRRSETSAPRMAVDSDTERFLYSSYLHLTGTKSPLPESSTDIPAPSVFPVHPWPEDMYEAVSAASLKHISGTATPSGNFSLSLLNALSDQVERPIDALFVSDKPTWPSHIYRVKNPVDALNRHGLNAIWLDKQSLVEAPELLNDTLRVIIHRLDWGPEYKEIIRECRKRRIPVGYDIDDLLFMPDLIASGARDSVNRLGRHEIQRWMQRSEEIQRCVRDADFFIGATQSLKVAAQEFNQDCRYIHNGFSPENLLMANLARANVRPNPKETVNIGYASGTATHQADFDVVAGTIWQLMREDPRILLTVVGPLEWNTKPPADVKTRIATRHLVPHVNLPFELARFDINIVPLERNAFCDAKSPLKFFEAGLVSVPTIATGNPTYESIGAKSQACLLANDQAAWYDHLHRLSRKTDLREKLGGLARKTAIENFHCELSINSYLQLPKKSNS